MLCSKRSVSHAHGHALWYDRARAYVYHRYEDGYGRAACCATPAERPTPTIYPDQINAVIKTAIEAGDTQVVNLVVFVCEGGFRFQLESVIPADQL